MPPPYTSARRLVHRSWRTTLAISSSLILLALPVSTARSAVAQPVFGWVEASIPDIHRAFAAGTLDCESLVRGYLERIQAYEDTGPALQSMVAVDSEALEEARHLDDVYETDGPVGSLHCVPIVLKDNIDTFDMPTTAGSLSLEGSQPPDDAFVVSRLRAAGALVLAKANMDEFAFGFGGSSSLGGQVRNPYDPARGPGGSSSGTGASVAASLAMAGLGTDTGGSIRVPSSVQGLVGIRPSLRLLSQDGIIPLARFQDTVGPMCRTVEDCALLLSAMVGFDSRPFSGQNAEPLQRDDEAVPMTSEAEYLAEVGIPPGFRYEDSLDPDALDGARIGVVRALFGNNGDVLTALDSAVDTMRAAGASVEDVVIPELSAIIGYASVSRWEFRDHLTSYLQSWPSDEDGHKRTFEEVAVSLQYEQGRTTTFVQYGANGATRAVDPDYERNTHERSEFVRPRLQATLDNASLDGAPLGEPYDVLLYPSVLSPPAVGGAPSTGSNNRLSAFSGFPALTMPAGFTTATPDRVALPIGMELLGREFAEPTLIKIAYAYQEAVRGTSLARQAPAFTPELSS